MNITPGITISNINDLAETIQEISRTNPPTRHPYVGELSFTALSDFQQNIIFKGLNRYEESANKIWDVPYLSLNPMDVGRVYESVTYQIADEENDRVIQTLSNNFGFQLPTLLAAEFSNYVKQRHEQDLEKLTAAEIRDLFMDSYSRNQTPIELKSINFEKATLTSEEDQLHCQAEVEYNSEVRKITGIGDGAIDTLVNALTSGLDLNFDVASFNQHALTRGSNALAATYIKVVSEDAKGYWGVGMDSDSTLSAIKAFFNALNRSQQK
jgi:2-isopropylmalate synthase